MSGVATDAERFTTLALRQAGGERRAVIFLCPLRRGGHPTCAGEEVPRTLLTDTRVGSVGTLGDGRAHAHHPAPVHRDGQGRRGVYRRRSQLPGDAVAQREDFLCQTERLLELADYVKLSDEETALVTGCTDPEKALEALERRGVRTAVVTRGKDGAIALSGGQLVRAAGVPAVAVDATGAGDAFWGGFLYRLLHQGAILWKRRRRGCWRTA